MGEPAEAISLKAPPTNTVDRLLVTIKRVAFYAKDSGYCVLKATPATQAEKGSRADQINIVGYMGNVQAGMSLLVWGVKETHKTHGEQLKVTRFEIPLAGDQGDMLGFLMSGTVKGIGPEKARRIVEKFGADTRRIFDDEIDRLTEVKGIGTKSLGGIVESWESNKNFMEAVVHFQSWGIGPKGVQKILKRWPNPGEAIQVVRENPYRLAWEIDGVGYLKADAIAKAIGFKLDSPARLQAALLYVLDKASEGDGHCYLEEETLIELSLEALFHDVPRPEGIEGIVRDQVEWLHGHQKILAIHPPLKTRGGRAVFVRKLWQAEFNLARQMARLLSEPCLVPDGLDKMILDYEREMGIEMHVDQRRAVATALESKASIVTGGPGTGKTTIIKAIQHIAGLIGIKKIGLVAPTGRAAKRMEESTGHKASTCHRFLEFSPEEGFRFNEKHPSEVELLIVDESSMIDVYLAAALISALGTRVRLVLVGDVHQLPSVGPGNVLKDFIVSGRVPCVELTKIFRQGEGSYISHNARAILRGKQKELCDFSKDKSIRDFYIGEVDLPPDSPAPERAKAITKWIVRYTAFLLTRGYKEKDIQILAPMKKGHCGTDALNLALRDLINPQGQTIKVGFKEFRIGDRVLQRRNNYEKEVFNGDQGYIRDVDVEENVVIIDFDGRDVDYDFKEMDDLVLAYAVTIHKSQGSEYPVVIIPITTGHYKLLARNLIYTGVTRAKKLCALYGEKKALGIAIRNNQIDKRNTLLAERLCGKLN